MNNNKFYIPPAFVYDFNHFGGHNVNFTLWCEMFDFIFDNYNLDIYFRRLSNNRCHWDIKKRETGLFAKAGFGDTSKITGISNISSSYFEAQRDAFIEVINIIRGESNLKLN